MAKIRGQTLNPQHLLRRIVPMRINSKSIGIILIIVCLFYFQEACTPLEESTVGPTINVVELTVQEIQQAYASEEYTSVDLVQAFLDQIKLYEDHCNSFI